MSCNFYRGEKNATSIHFSLSILEHIHALSITPKPLQYAIYSTPEKLKMNFKNIIKGTFMGPVLHLVRIFGIRPDTPRVLTLRKQQYTITEVGARDV